MLKFSKKINTKVVSIILGFLALVWFLIRVIPKPSRADYPCQKAAFPIASTFVLWIIGVFSSYSLFKKVKVNFYKSFNFKLVAFSGLFLVAIIFTFFATPQISLLGKTKSNYEIVSMKQVTNPVIDSLTSKVAIVKSKKANAVDITYVELELMIREAITKAGGLDTILKGAKEVILKPNLVGTPGNNQLTANGKTTDWRVVEITAKIVKEINSTCKIVIMEGTAGNTRAIFTSMGYYNIKYIDEILAIDEVSGGYRDYNATELKSVSLVDSMSLYPDNEKPNNDRKIYLNKRYFNADVVISLPTIKNHQSAGITGAIKNVSIGATPANIYADQNLTLRSTTINHERAKLSRWIHDYYACRPINFVITDGLQGLQYGPGGSANGGITKNQKNMRIIMASKDPIAHDAIQGLLIQQDPEKVDYLVYLNNQGFGTANPGLINVVSDEKIEQLRTIFNHNTADAIYSMFYTTTCANYNLSYKIENNQLNIKVENPANLARIELKIDNQVVNKYIVGSFSDVNVDLSNVTITSGALDVVFYDRFLNTLSKHFDGPTFVETVSDDYFEPYIFPNPVINTLFVRSSSTQPIISSIEIYSNSGQLVLSTQKYSINNFTGIDISQLKAGAYFARITNNNVASKGIPFIKK